MCKHTAYAMPTTKQEVKKMGANSQHMQEVVELGAVSSLTLGRGKRSDEGQIARRPLY